MSMAAWSARLRAASIHLDHTNVSGDATAQIRDKSDPATTSSGSENFLRNQGDERVSKPTQCRLEAQRCSKQYKPLNRSGLQGTTNCCERTAQRVPHEEWLHSVRLLRNRCHARGDSPATVCVQACRSVRAWRDPFEQLDTETLMQAITHSAYGRSEVPDVRSFDWRL